MQFIGTEKKLEEQVQTSKLSQLTAMGFPEEWAKEALNQTNGDVEAAIGKLTNRVAEFGTDASFPTNDEPNAAMISQLRDMGFTEEQATFALSACDNNVERAIELLFNQ